MDNINKIQHNNKLFW